MKKVLLILCLFLPFSILAVNTPFITPKTKKEVRQEKKREIRLKKQKSKIEHIQNFLSSDVGQWILKRAEKRQDRLEKKLQRAKKNNKLKKVKCIKKRMKPKLSRGLKWIIIGLFFMILAILIVNIITIPISIGNSYYFIVLLFILGALFFAKGTNIINQEKLEEEFTKNKY